MARTRLAGLWVVAVVALLSACTGDGYGLLSLSQDIAALLVDEDRDGILDSSDICPHTERGAAVDPQGCGTSQLDESRRLRMPAAVATLTRPYAVTMAGQGTEFVGMFETADNVGTIEIDGTTLELIVCGRIDWSAIEQVVYDAIAVVPDRIYLLWFYSTYDGAITDIYYVGTDYYFERRGTRMAWEPVSAGLVYRCDETQTTTTVELPALDMPFPQTVTGYTLTADDLALVSDGPVWLSLDGADLLVFPLAFVDCTECPAGQDWPPPWLEFQVLLWDPAAVRMCIGIIYVCPADEEGPTASVGWTTLCLPDFEEFYEIYGPYRDRPATWTVPK